MKRWSRAIFSIFRRDLCSEGYRWKNSLNYSVGYRAPNVARAFSGFAASATSARTGQPARADPDVPTCDHPADILSTELDRLREMMLGLINQIGAL